MRTEIHDLTILATAALTLVVLLVGHNLADHVLGQSDRQADHKGAPTPQEVADGASPRRGWGACLAHVAQYHLVLAVLLGLIWLALPLHWTFTGLAAGLAWSALTHAALDRRFTVRWILTHTGSPDFAQLRSAGLNGMYLTRPCTARPSSAPPC